MERKVQRECPVCGIAYEADPVRLRHGRQTTCSRACSYRFRGAQQEKGIALRCPVCEAEFTRTASHVKAKHGANYCSAACQYAGRTLGLTPRVVLEPYVRVAPVNREAIARTVATRRARDNYRHSDETRARLSEATARSIAEGRVPAVSSLEDVVSAELDRLGVAHRRQVAIRGEGGRFVACVDFLLDDGRAVEVNGTFWHADPRRYPDGPRFPAQVRTAERWARKVAALESLGVPLVVVWEDDLRDGPTQALVSALGR